MHTEAQTTRAKLLFGIAGLAAATAFTVFGLQSTAPDDSSRMTVPEAQATMQFGQTVTQSAPPSQPDTPAATPPVKAEPAPTAEPG
ncbi:hypothetical protein A5740_06690 [Mycobacterium sp. GA-1841]|nr:hypothetical protein A5740_06690 [Mycobacterium sp. GA-1841]